MKLESDPTISNLQLRMSNKLTHGRYERFAMLRICSLLVYAAVQHAGVALARVKTFPIRFEKGERESTALFEPAVLCNVASTAAIETTKDLEKRLGQQEKSINDTVRDLKGLQEDIEKLEETVDDKADSTTVTTQLNTLQQQMSDTLADLQRDLAQKPDAARVVQHLNALKRQINHNMQQLHPVLNRKVRAVKFSGFGSAGLRACVR